MLTADAVSSSTSSIHPVPTVDNNMASRILPKPPNFYLANSSNSASKDWIRSMTCSGVVPVESRI